MNISFRIELLIKYWKEQERCPLIADTNFCSTDTVHSHDYWWCHQTLLLLGTSIACTLYDIYSLNINQQQSFTYFLYLSYCRAVRSDSAGSISRPSVQKPPLFSPSGPILSFEKCSLDRTGALHGPNLILSGCLYNFETNTLFIRLRFVFDIHSRGRWNLGERALKVVSLIP